MLTDPGNSQLRFSTRKAYTRVKRPLSSLHQAPMKLEVGLIYVSLTFRPGPSGLSPGSFHLCSKLERMYFTSELQRFRMLALSLTFLLPILLSRRRNPHCKNSLDGYKYSTLETRQLHLFIY